MRVDKISQRIQKKTKVSFSSYESSFRKKYIYRVIAFSIESWPISTLSDIHIRVTTRFFTQYTKNKKEILDAYILRNT